MSKQVYYKLECDSEKRPKNIYTDMYFNLNETEFLADLIYQLIKVDIDYTVFIEEFNEDNSEITNRIYLTNNNLT